MPVKDAPKGEVGYVNENWGSGWGNLDWGAMMRHAEETPDLKWPKLTRSTRLMLNDSQLQALYAMTMLPIRGYRYFIDPNGAPDEIVRHIAGDLGLPIMGGEDEFKRTATLRFSFKRHAYHALKAVIPGHSYFEKVGEIMPDGLWHLAKLSFRPPESIQDFKVNEDGSLDRIIQSASVLGKKREMPRSRLAAYVWDGEDGDWIGRSMLRSCYRDWLVKDRLIRVNAINIERGGGIPWAKASSDLSGPQMRALAETARDFKVSEEGGAALPPGAEIKIEKASAPDAITTIRYHDESMARAWLAMFAMLGQTQSGSRALGGTFVDFFGVGQEATAGWFVDTMNDEVVRDLVEWNYGPQELMPLVSYEVPSGSASVEEITQLVTAGLITVDPELESELRKRTRLPQRVATEEVPQGQPFGYDLDSGVITIDERRAQLGLPPREDGLGALTVPEFLLQFGGNTEDAVKPEESPPPVEAGGNTRPPLKARAAAGDDSVGHRKPYEHEITAAVDFDEIEERYQATVTDALSAWQADVKPKQIEELVAAIEDADGDLEKLSALSVTTLGDDVLGPYIEASYGTGQQTAIEEADSQGVELSTADPETAAQLITDRAEALAAVIGAGLALSAAGKAIAWAGGTMGATALASKVAEFLVGLKDTQASDAIKGTVQGSFNRGRFDAMSTVAADVATDYYGSELLDANTCSPCAQNDGKQYGSLPELEEDYPEGYVECEGGPRCRGTGVALYV